MRSFRLDIDETVTSSELFPDEMMQYYKLHIIWILYHELTSLVKLSGTHQLAFVKWYLPAEDQQKRFIVKSNTEI
jgi:hypothetical protein